MGVANDFTKTITFFDDRGGKKKCRDSFELGINSKIR